MEESESPIGKISERETDLKEFLFRGVIKEVCLHLREPIKEELGRRKREVELKGDNLKPFLENPEGALNPSLITERLQGEEGERLLEAVRDYVNHILESNSPLLGKIDELMRLIGESGAPSIPYSEATYKELTSIFPEGTFFKLEFFIEEIKGLSPELREILLEKFPDLVSQEFRTRVEQMQQKGETELFVRRFSDFLIKAIEGRFPQDRVPRQDERKEVDKGIPQEGCPIGEGPKEDLLPSDNQGGTEPRDEEQFIRLSIEQYINRVKDILEKNNFYDSKKDPQELVDSILKELLDSLVPGTSLSFREYHRVSTGIETVLSYILSFVLIEKKLEEAEKRKSKSTKPTTLSFSLPSLSFVHPVIVKVISEKMEEMKIKGKNFNILIEFKEKEFTPKEIDFVPKYVENDKTSLFTERMDKFLSLLGVIWTDVFNGQEGESVLPSEEEIQNFGKLFKESPLSIKQWYRGFIDFLEFLRKGGFSPSMRINVFNIENAGRMFLDFILSGVTNFPITEIDVRSSDPGVSFYNTIIRWMNLSSTQGRPIYNKMDINLFLNFFFSPANLYSGPGKTLLEALGNNKEAASRIIRAIYFYNTILYFETTTDAGFQLAKNSFQKLGGVTPQYTLLKTPSGEERRYISLTASYNEGRKTMPSFPIYLDPEFFRRLFLPESKQREAFIIVAPHGMGKSFTGRMIGRLGEILSGGSPTYFSNPQKLKELENKNLDSLPFIIVDEVDIFDENTKVRLDNILGKNPRIVLCVNNLNGITALRETLEEKGYSPFYLEIREEEFIYPYPGSERILIGKVIEDSKELPPPSTYTDKLEKLIKGLERIGFRS